MSAKQAYYKPRFNLKRLSDDILTEVFRHATWVPYGVDPSDLVPEKLQSSTAKAIYKEYRASLVTKRYLVRVCKSWHRLATLYLYEWVVLGRAKNLRPLIRGAQRLLSPRGPSSGQCTKRLDLAIRVGGDETNQNDFNEALKELLPTLPNLETLIEKRWKYTIGDFLACTSRGEACSKLKVLNGPISLDVALASWYTFFKKHPNLTSINIADDVTIDLFPEGPVPFAHERVTTLNLNVTSKFQPAGQGLNFISFPSLNRFSILFWDYDDMHRSGWEKFFLKCASPSVTVIQLNFFVARVQKLLADTNSDAHEITKLRPLFSSCPNLKRVDVVLDHWDSVIIRRALTLVCIPSTVSVIGIRVCGTKPAKHVTERFLGGLKMLLDSMTSTVVIQFLDERTHEYLLHSWRAFVRESQKTLILTSWLTPDGKQFNL